MNSRLIGPATRRTVAALVALLATALTLLVLASPAKADTIMVNNNNDPGNGTCGQPTDCTLREAIRTADSGDTIKFSPIVSGTIKLSRSDGDLVVSKSLNIEGPGRDKLTISGEGYGGVFYIGLRNPQVVIRDLTLSGGKGLVEPFPYLTGGGGIFKQSGRLSLIDSRVSGNRAETGAGIYNRSGPLLLRNTIVSGNTAKVIPDNVIVSHGPGANGGGIYNGNGTILWLQRSSVYNNRADDGDGGGIYNGNGRLMVTDTTMSNNSAYTGGGVHNRDKLYLTSSTVSGNHASGVGGGVFSNTSDVSSSNPYPAQRTNIESSTISGNTASGYVPGFGGPDFDGGSGVRNGNGLTMIKNSTVTGNAMTSREGGGVASGRLGTRTEVRNSIISRNSNPRNGNTALIEYNDVNMIGSRHSHSFESKGSNLVGVGDAAGYFHKAGDLNQVTDPGLHNLGYNGGLTKTHKLHTGSPAIDKGSDCLIKDQRGFARPQDGDGNGSKVCDIGAIELKSPPDTVKPTVNRLSPKPGAIIKDRTPTIRATIKDNRTNLKKGSIKLYVDGRRKTNFRYSTSTDRLIYTTGRLAYKRHSVKIVAEDAAGNTAAESWRFTVKKKR